MTCDLLTDSLPLDPWINVHTPLAGVAPSCKQYPLVAAVSAAMQTPGSPYRLHMTIELCTTGQHYHCGPKMPISVAGTATVSRRARDGRDEERGLIAPPS